MWLLRNDSIGNIEEYRSFTSLGSLIFDISLLLVRDGRKMLNINEVMHIKAQMSHTPTPSIPT